MGKPKPPTPPDPQETASAQTAQNIGTAITQQHLNNVNQVTPDGKLTYKQTGTRTHRDPLSGREYQIPTYTAVQTLSDSQRAIKKQSDRASLNFASLAANQSSRLDGMLSDPIDTSGLPDRGDASTLRTPEFNTTYSTDFSEDRQRVEDALMQRMQGGLDRDRGALEARLASQGIRVGSEAYQAAMDDHGRQSNDARLAAILGAGQEQSRLVGMEAQRAGFENQAATSVFNTDLTKMNAQDQSRNQALQEQFAVRNQPINEITALMSGSQVSSPNFVNPNSAQLANTDYAGVVANNFGQKMQNYNARMGAWNNLFGGLAGLGGNLIMASDRRVKTDVKKLGKTEAGLGIYKYRYKGSDRPQIGLMAQEVEKKNPDAVVTVNGLKMVNYDRALGGAT